MRAACGAFATATSLAGDTESGHVGGVIEFLRGDMEQMRADPERAHLILREVLDSGPGRGQALASEVFDGHFRQIVRLVRAGQEAGVFARDVVPEAAAVALASAGVCVFQCRHVLRHLPGVEFTDDPALYADLVGRVLLDGLRVRGTS